jgi:hypothetical protein
MSFKIKSEPIKPVRKKNVKYTEYLWDGQCLGHLQGWAEKHGATLDDITIEKEWGYYDEVSILATICVDEIEEDFQRRLKYYEVRKKKYDEWYKTNKKSIEKELRRRKKVEIEAEKKRKEREKERKKKEKIKLEKRLAKLNKELGKK